MSQAIVFFRLVATLAWGTLIVAAGCADSSEQANEGDRSMSKARRLSPEPPQSFTGSVWSSIHKDDDVVATVNGAVIGRTMVDTVVESNPLLSHQQALERLIELELLSQAAIQKAFHEREAVMQTWRQAMVQRFLAVDFDLKVSPEKIPLEQVTKIYWIPRVRKLYDHTDTWRMAHLFISCCDIKYERCDTEEVMNCFTHAGEVIGKVYTQMKERVSDVEGEPKLVSERMSDYRVAVEAIWPQLAYREMSFYYDPEKPHDEQKGYTIIAEAVATTAIEGQRGTLSKPVQSPFGWHVIMKWDHIPEKRLGPNEPEVIADIRNKAFPKYQQAKFNDLIGMIRSKMLTSTHVEHLELLGEKTHAHRLGEHGRGS